LVERIEAVPTTASVAGGVETVVVVKVGVGDGDPRGDNSGESDCDAASDPDDDDPNEDELPESLSLGLKGRSFRVLKAVPFVMQMNEIEMNNNVTRCLSLPRLLKILLCASTGFEPLPVPRDAIFCG